MKGVLTKVAQLEVDWLGLAIDAPPGIDRAVLRVDADIQHAKESLNTWLASRIGVKQVPAGKRDLRKAELRLLGAARRLADAHVAALGTVVGTSLPSREVLASQLRARGLELLGLPPEAIGFGRATPKLLRLRSQVLATIERRRARRARHEDTHDDNAWRWEGGG